MRNSRGFAGEQAGFRARLRVGDAGHRSCSLQRAMRFLSRSRTPRDRARIERDLERHGVSGEAREILARRLEGLAPALSEDAYRAALAGALVAHDLHEHSARRVERSVRDYQEIQRLLTVFGAEMKKLDEALRVLSAYVQRMRTRARTTTRTESVH